MTGHVYCQAVAEHGHKCGKIIMSTQQMDAKYNMSASVRELKAKTIF